MNGLYLNEKIFKSYRNNTFTACHICRAFTCSSFNKHGGGVEMEYCLKCKKTKTKNGVCGKCAYKKIVQGMLK